MTPMLSVLWLAAAVQAPNPPAFEVGPAVGETIPAFQAPDQDGRARSFAES